MTPSRTPSWDLRWTRCDLAALAILAAAAAVALAAQSIGRHDLGEQMTIRPDRVQAASELVDPNTAGAASLRRLPGVGPRIAERIIAHRQAAGPGAFASPDDLAAVSGIGPKTVDELRPHLQFADDGGRSLQPPPAGR